MRWRRRGAEQEMHARENLETDAREDMETVVFVLAG